MRLTGGQLGGRKLRRPPPGVRPSSDRVREATFARLGDLHGARVLDLYAGTGALGLEALSRGAESLVCVERASRSLAVLRANLADLGVSDLVEVIAGDVLRTVRRLGAAARRFDLVLADPPYASEALPDLLAELREAALVEADGMVVIERSRRHSLPEADGWDLLDERRYGDTVIARLTPVPSPPGEPIRA